MTGNLKNYRNENGQLVIDVTFCGGDAPEYQFMRPSFLASFRGWHRGDHAVGQGPTKEAAVADLRKQTGILEDCEISGGERP